MLVKWEYMIARSPYGELLDKNLNAYGEQGWELAAVYGNDRSWFYYFKRPLV